MRLAHLLAFVSLAVAACGDSTSMADDAGSGTPDARPIDVDSTDLPCDVGRVLMTNCWECHTDPPRNSAPMPMVEAADLAADAPNSPGQVVWEVIGVRVRAPGSPMPPRPRPRVGPDDIATLDRWFAAGLPTRSAAEICSP